MLCEKCTDVRFTPRENCPASLEELFDTSSPELNEIDQVYLHSEDSTCLKSSADAGCQLCAMIWYHFDYGRYANHSYYRYNEQIVFARIHPKPFEQTPDIRAYHKKAFLGLHCVDRYPGKQCLSLSMFSIMIGKQSVSSRCWPPWRYQMSLPLASVCRLHTIKPETCSHASQIPQQSHQQTFH
jgi:hypothetical protein